MKKRRLSKDEQALWRRATRDVRQLGLRGPAGPDEAPSGPLPLSLGETRKDTAFPVRGHAPNRGRERAGLPGAFSAGDPGMERRLKRGRLPIERTIDLHGLTQAAAHVALKAFLESARRDGCRCVRVITGRGGGGENPMFGAGRAPRGVIRRRFQDWINEDPLRSMIARAAPAAPKDGGPGAFYVFLKSADKKAGR